MWLCVSVAGVASCSRCGGEHAGGGGPHHRRRLQAAQSKAPACATRLCSRHPPPPQTVGPFNVSLIFSAQVRIEQVIVAEPGAVLLYKLSNLLKFYHHTIGYLTAASAKRETFLPLRCCIDDVWNLPADVKLVEGT